LIQGSFRAKEIKTHPNLFFPHLSATQVKSIRYGIEPQYKKIFRTVWCMAHLLLIYIGMDSVLVVDDNRDLGMLTSEMLVERGFRVNIAFDGETALARIKQEPYDVMILDYRLPGISGLTVLEKTQQIRPNLKTIMISAFGDGPTRARAQELGAYAFLDKPFNIDGLVKVAKKALNKPR